MTLDSAEGSQPLVTVGNQNFCEFPIGGIACKILNTTDDEHEINHDEQDDEEEVAVSEKMISTIIPPFRSS